MTTASTRISRGLVALLIAVAGVLGATVPADAQLSPSPWPMLQHDLRHTGRSPLLGPLFTGNAPPPGAVKSLTFYDKIKMHPVIGVDGTIYVGMGWQFCAINPNMTLKWCKPTIADVSSNAAAIDAAGFIYFGDRDNTFYKYSPAGDRIATHNHGHEGDIDSSAVIALDGTIYISFIQNLNGFGVVTALKTHPTDPQKFQEKWAVPYVAGAFGTTSSPAIGPNGTIYVGFANGTLHALKDNGSSFEFLWAKPVGTNRIISSPTIGADGTVYIGSNTGFHALDPATGDTKWTFPTLGFVGHTTAQATDGTLYFVAQSSAIRTVYALTPGATSATLKWQYRKSVNSTGTGYPIIGADGIVYVGFGSGVYAFNPVDGNVLWSFQTGAGIISSPLLGLPPAGVPAATPNQNGTAVLVMGSHDHKVYAISSARTGQNDPPQPHITVTPGTSVSAGQLVTLDGLGNPDTTDPEGNQIYYAWDLGDGTTATGPFVQHTYWAAGSYVVTLSVTDGLEDAETSVTINVSGSGSAIFCDDFTRPSYPSEVLGGPTASALPAPCAPGSPLQWKEQTGNLRIVDGQLVNLASKATHIATIEDMGGADQAVAADFTSTTNMTVPRFGLLLRASEDARTYYMAYRAAGGASVLRLSRVVNGVETVLAQTAVPNPTVNVPFRLRASAVGATLTLSLVGGKSISVSDSAIGGGTLGVLFTWQTTATPVYRADNFTACSGPPGTDCAGIP